jgi:hypothetical protein
MSSVHPYIPNGCDQQGRVGEMAVYDPTEDDAKPEPMTPADAVAAVLIYVASMAFVAWLVNFAARAAASS